MHPRSLYVVIGDVGRIKGEVWVCRVALGVHQRCGTEREFSAAYLLCVPLHGSAVPPCPPKPLMFRLDREEG